MGLGMNNCIVQQVQAALDGTGDKWTIPITQKVRVVRWGFIVTVATTGTVGSLALDRTPQGGSRANNYDTALTIPNLAIGQIRCSSPDSLLEPDPGDVLHFAVDTATTAGDGYLFIELDERGGFSDVNSNVTQV